MKYRMQPSGTGEQAIRIDFEYLVNALKFLGLPNDTEVIDMKVTGDNEYVFGPPNLVLRVRHPCAYRMSRGQHLVQERLEDFKERIKNLTDDASAG